MTVAEIGQFPDWFCRAMAGPSVGLALLARLMFDADDGAGALVTGTKRYHNGQGRLVTLDGERFDGLQDPGETRWVDIGAIEEPRAGVASTVELTLSGADLPFIRTVYGEGDRFEGRDAEILLQAFDPSSSALIGPPLEIFAGQMTVPQILRPARDVRIVKLTVESEMWSARAFATAGMLSDADQKRRYPGDTVMRHVGQNMITRWPGKK